jgi:hypothetical protein
MFRKSIKQKIVGIAAGLIVLSVIHRFKANPPAADWDGAWHLERK